MKLGIKIAMLAVLWMLNEQTYAGVYKCTSPAGEIAYQLAECSSGSAQFMLNTDQSFSGPLETWQRLGEALARGDKKAALNELTSDLAERFAPLFDSLLSQKDSFDIASLGTVSDINMIGDSLAELTLVRKTPTGNLGFSVQLLRRPNGKWLIAEM
jgi:hypothetical protein